jgi:hypothetical protein
VLGMSSKFPIKGHPFGPGGNGGRVLLMARYKGIRMRTRTTTPTVGNGVDILHSAARKVMRPYFGEMVFYNASPASSTQRGRGVAPTPALPSTSKISRG